MGNTRLSVIRILSYNMMAAVGTSERWQRGSRDGKYWTRGPNRSEVTKDNDTETDYHVAGTCVTNEADDEIAYLLAKGRWEERRLLAAQSIKRQKR